MERDYTTREDAARKAEVTQPTISNYISRGWLSAIKLGGRWRIRRDSLDKLLRDGPPAAKP